MGKITFKDETELVVKCSKLMGKEANRYWIKGMCEDEERSDKVGLGI